MLSRDSMNWLNSRVPLLFCSESSSASIRFLIGKPSNVLEAVKSLIFFTICWSLLNWERTTSISDDSFKVGTWRHALKQSTRSISCMMLFMLVVPIIISLRFRFGGHFLISTKSACRIGFENLGPI